MDGHILVLKDRQIDPLLIEQIKDTERLLKEQIILESIHMKQKFDDDDINHTKSVILNNDSRIANFSNMSNDSKNNINNNREDSMESTKIKQSNSGENRCSMNNYSTDRALQKNNCDDTFLHFDSHSKSKNLDYSNNHDNDNTDDKNDNDHDNNHFYFDQNRSRLKVGNRHNFEVNLRNSFDTNINRDENITIDNFNNNDNSNYSSIRNNHNKDTDNIYANRHSKDERSYNGMQYSNAITPSISQDLLTQRTFRQVSTQAAQNTLQSRMIDLNDNNSNYDNSNNYNNDNNHDEKKYNIYDNKNDIGNNNLNINNSIDMNAQQRYNDNNYNQYITDNSNSKNIDYDNSVGDISQKYTGITDKNTNNNTNNNHDKSVDNSRNTNNNISYLTNPLQNSISPNRSNSSTFRSFDKFSNLTQTNDFSNVSFMKLRKSYLNSENDLNENSNSVNTEENIFSVSPMNNGLQRKEDMHTGYASSSSFILTKPVLTHLLKNEIVMPEIRKIFQDVRMSQTNDNKVNQNISKIVDNNAYGRNDDMNNNHPYSDSNSYNNDANDRKNFNIKNISGTEIYRNSNNMKNSTDINIIKDGGNIYNNDHDHRSKVHTLGYDLHMLSKKIDSFSSCAVSFKR